jgi:hypothetical protein
MALTRLSGFACQRKEALEAAEAADRRISILLAHGRPMIFPTVEEMGKAIGLTRDGVYRRYRRPPESLTADRLALGDLSTLDGPALLECLHQLWEEREAAWSRSRQLLAEMR